MISHAHAAIIGLLMFGGPAVAQAVANGEQEFGVCAACHAVGPNAPNKVGPELNGLDGRKAGGVAAFRNYSTAMTSSGIVWDRAHFVDYMLHPQKAIPGNRMPYSGARNEKAADDLWAYLTQFQADGSKK